MKQDKFYLSIQIGKSQFNANFVSIDDILRDDVWAAATGILHDMIKNAVAKDEIRD